MTEDHKNICPKVPFIFTCRYPFIFILFAIIGLIIYLPAFNVGFLSDDYYSLTIFREQGLRIFFDSEDKIFMPLMLLVMGVLYKFFGLHPLGYHIFILLLHVMNAVLLVWFTERLLKYLEWIKGRTFLPAFLAGLLFIVNPYHTEAVTWISSIGYPLSLAFYFGCLLVFLQWMQSSRTGWLLLSGMLFFLAILAKEVSLSLPGILLLIFIVGHAIKKRKWELPFFYKTGLISLFFMLLIIFYFLLRYLFIGEFIGHYGTDVHMNFGPHRILSGAIAYIAKFFLAYRFLPEPLHEVFRFINRYIYVFTGILILVLALMYYARNAIKKRLFMPAVHLVFLFTACFFISMFTVVNLELSFLGEIQSDRYGYFTSVFFTLVAVFIMVALTGRNIRMNLILLLPVLWFAVLTCDENKKWEHSSVIADNFYRCLKAKNIEGRDLYLLNVPDTYKGAYVLRSCAEEGLRVKDICSSCRVHILSYIAIKGDSGILNYSRDSDCIMVRTTAADIKFLPCEQMFRSPGFIYSATTAGLLRICFEGQLPPTTSIYFIEPDGTIQDVKGSKSF
jgi:protein O-mannosyl-transferase